MAIKSMQRSLERIKTFGWIYWRTEHWDYYAKKRKDLFQFCDILCLDELRTVAVQACGSDLSQHIEKIKTNEYVIPWLSANNELQIWAWRKRKKVRGKKATYWSPRIVDVIFLNNELFFEERS